MAFEDYSKQAEIFRISGDTYFLSSGLVVVNDPDVKRHFKEGLSDLTEAIVYRIIDGKIDPELNWANWTPQNVALSLRMGAESGHVLSHGSRIDSTNLLSPFDSPMYLFPIKGFHIAAPKRDFDYLAEVAKQITGTNDLEVKLSLESHLVVQSGGKIIGAFAPLGDGDSIKSSNLVATYQTDGEGIIRMVNVPLAKLVNP